MESFIVYIVKIGVCLLVFLAVYAIFLRKTTFFRFNRCFLLIGFIGSLIIPVIKCTYDVIMPVFPSNNIPIDIDTANTVLVQPSSFNIWSIFFAIYLLGTLLLIARNIYAFVRLSKLIKRGNIVNDNGYKVIESISVDSPFTFFNYIFLGIKEITQKEKDLILQHETTHINQKHWIDLLCGECMLLLQWFNPFAWIYVRLLKENHEYLADKAVIESGVSPALYQAVLINQKFQGPVFSFSNSFNYPKLLNRLSMIKKTKSSPWKRITVLLIIPVFGLFVWASAEPRYVMEYPEQLGDTVPVRVTNKLEVKQYSAEQIERDTVPMRVTNKLGVKQYSAEQIERDSVPIRVKNILKVDQYLTEQMKKDPDPLYGLCQITISSDSNKVHIYRHIINDSTRLTIRDMSFDKGKEPLVIIDGEIVDAKELLKVEMSNLKTFSILKGKSAIDAYAEEGKNGVIIIKTKPKKD